MFHSLLCIHYYMNSVHIRYCNTLFGIFNIFHPSYRRNNPGTQSSSNTCKHVRWAYVGKNTRKNKAKMTQDRKTCHFCFVLFCLVRSIIPLIPLIHQLFVVVFFDQVFPSSFCFVLFFLFLLCERGLIAYYS
jgi:hypothetical protein